jgi:hypothetical protein
MRDQIYPIGAGHPKKQVIVTLMSYGGKANPALQIGERIRKRGMSTFVPPPKAKMKSRRFMVKMALPSVRLRS